MLAKELQDAQFEVWLARAFNQKMGREATRAMNEAEIAWEMLCRATERLNRLQSAAKAIPSEVPK